MVNFEGKRLLRGAQSVSGARTARLDSSLKTLLYVNMVWGLAMANVNKPFRSSFMRTAPSQVVAQPGGASSGFGQGGGNRYGVAFEDAESSRYIGFCIYGNGKGDSILKFSIYGAWAA
ncbi:hypothetical protein NUW58_g8059 [Xylaria curta]|uniref:Uncharacterized protein n=1 Tax=Xylaria curta TaxID=42375 RepID=A0ACC1NBT9_9PEZI|nr:hypothetical protein NUW58_g8059 [Xylaria curta]